MPVFACRAAPAARLYEAVVCGERGLSQSRCFASPASAVPLGTPTGEMDSLKGVVTPLAAFFAYFLSHHRK